MNAMTDIVNSTASGAITEASNIASGSVGQVIVFFLAFALLAWVVGLIYWALRKKG